MNNNSYKNPILIFRCRKYNNDLHPNQKKDNKLNGWCMKCR